MGFDADIYRQAMQTVTQRRIKAEHDALMIKNRLYTELDGFEQADKALITACSQIPRAFLSGGNMDELRKDCETLQKKTRRYPYFCRL